MSGILYLIPSSLSPTMNDVLPAGQLEIVKSLKEFVVEEPKTARQFLKQIGTVHALQDITLHVLNEHTDPATIREFLHSAKEGNSIGLLSEAGCPAVADPGSELVRLAHKAGIKVKPLIGPSSILLALMASGMNGQSFCFHGYLPRDPAARKKKLKELEKESQRKNQTQIFIETPYRNNQIITDVISTCEDPTLFCIAEDLTSPAERIRTKSIAEWKKSPPKTEKVPAIFLIGS